MIGNALKVGNGSDAARQVSVSEENSVSSPEPASIPDKQMTQPVMLVPKIAPSTMGIACLTFMMPEFTKPTTITDVADED